MKKQILASLVCLSISNMVFSQLGGVLTKPMPEKEFQQVKSMLGKMDPKSYLIKMKVVGANGQVRNEILGMKNLAGLQKDALTGGFSVDNSASMFKVPGRDGTQGNNGPGFGINNGTRSEPGNNNSQGSGFGMNNPNQGGVQEPGAGAGNQSGQGFGTRIDQMGNNSPGISRPAGMAMGKDGATTGGGDKPDAGGSKTDPGPKTGSNVGSGGATPPSSGGDRTPPNSTGSGGSGGDRTPPNSSGDRTPPNSSGVNSGGNYTTTPPNRSPDGPKPPNDYGGNNVPGETRASMPNPDRSSGNGKLALAPGSQGAVGAVRTNPSMAAGIKKPGLATGRSIITLPGNFQQGSYFICDLCNSKSLGVAGVQKLERLLMKYK